jgi:TetR/AcrR family transcriptional regulator, transcriptional repressor for nem operon
MAQPTQRRVETRQRILTAAGHLFREHGIDGIGVDAVMKEAGLTHGGFYLHFSSKEALAAEVFQTLLSQAADKWDEISRSADQEAALAHIVHNYLDPSRTASAHCCPLTTLGPDVARRSTSREAIGGALRGMIDALARVLPNRKQQNALAALSTMVGAVVLSRLACDPALAEAFLEAAADSILPPKQPHAEPGEAKQDQAKPGGGEQDHAEPGEAKQDHAEPSGGKQARAERSSAEQSRHDTELSVEQQGA